MTSTLARPRTFMKLVIDASISMSKLRARTISALNEFLDTHRYQRIDELFVTYTTFNTKTKTHYRNVPIAEVEPITERAYDPGGATALYDGIVDSLEDIDKDVGPGDRVLIVVLTDGEENSSKRVTRLSDLLRIKSGYEERGNWTFIYLGGMDADQAFRTGRSMGFADGNINNYGGGDVSGGLAKVSKATTRYRESDDLHTSNFYDQQARWKTPEWPSEPDVIITDK